MADINHLIYLAAERYLAGSTAAGGMFVQGGAASGAALVGNPVLIGGSDGTNARTILTDTTGLLQVGSFAEIIEVTPTLDTNIYADGDLLFDATEATNFVRAVGKRAVIQSVTIIDKSDQGVAFDLFTAYETVDFGTVNAAPSPSDADAAKCQRLCRIEESDYIDLGGNRVATVTNLGLVIEPAAASRSMFFMGVTRGGTPTYASNGLVIRLGVIGLD